MSDSIESVSAYCRENSRVCPMPQRWNTLYELLPNRKRVGGGWEPALPLILAAWYETPAMLKMLRVAEHIGWAAEHGELETVVTFLRGLREDEWFHSGD